MELTLKNSKGDILTAVLPWEQMRADLVTDLRKPDGNSDAPLAEDVAKLAELEGEFREAQAEVAQLEERVGELQNYFTNMTPEAYLELGKRLGFDVSMPEATVAEEAEGEGTVLASAPPVAPETPAAPVQEPKPEVVYADPHDPDYEHLELTGKWVLRDEALARQRAATASV